MIERAGCNTALYNVSGLHVCLANDAVIRFVTWSRRHDPQTQPREKQLRDQSFLCCVRYTRSCFAQCQGLNFKAMNKK